MTTKQDECVRAWNLLREGERPEGMLWNAWDRCFMDGHQDDPTCDHEERNSYEAYDRLCQAVEDVLLGMCMSHDMNVNTGHHRWFDMEDSLMASNECRLTAACDALEAERKSDD